MRATDFSEYFQLKRVYSKLAKVVGIRMVEVLRNILPQSIRDLPKKASGSEMELRKSTLSCSKNLVRYMWTRSCK